MAVPEVIVWEPAPSPERVLLAEWAPVNPGPEFVDRPPCPVCGHPTNDCTIHITILED